MFLTKALTIRVMAGAKKNFIKEEDGRWRVYLQAPPLEGRANKALVELLSGYFKVRKSQIEIIKGLKSRDKIVNINGLK